MLLAFGFIPILLLTFQHIHFGTGIPRTFEAYDGTDKEPTFYDSDNFFIVYLPNLNYQKDADQINDQINDPISDMGLEILKIIQNNPGISVNGIFKILKELNEKVTLDIIRNSIRRELYNLIEHRGSKKTGGYYTKTNVK